MARVIKKILHITPLYLATVLLLGLVPEAIQSWTGTPALSLRGLNPQRVSRRFMLAAASDSTAAASADKFTPDIRIEEQCEEIYGVLPCSSSIGGNLFLMAAYGYLILVAVQLITEGSEMLLQVVDQGIIAGLLLPILGAMPDTLLILVSGIGGTKEEAQEEVLVGMGVLAGSTINILTVAWAGSLLCGRCDLVPREGRGLVAKDRTLTKPYDLVHTGVTTDEQTRVGAWIMVGTLVPYIIMQVPIMLNAGESEGTWASLIGLILATASLFCCCTYQVMSPWLQKKRIEEARMHYIRTLAVRDLHNLAMSKAFGALMNSDGSVNSVSFGKMFDLFDKDSSGSLCKSELRALVLGLGARQGTVPEAEKVNTWMSEFDMDANEEIARAEFITGMAKWMCKVKGHASHRSVSTKSNASGQNPFWESQATVASREVKRLMDTIEEEDDEGEGEEGPPKTPAQIVQGAVLHIAAGAVLVGIFADPVVETIEAFSRAASIPPFFVAFVACPLASNASELVSSLIFALKKKKRTISLTYSQVYGAITMNNSLCMGAFLALVFFRGLVWDFSAEVAVILLCTVAVGIIGGTRKTFPTWMAFAVLSFYPLSIGIVCFLDYVLGWH